MMERKKKKNTITSKTPQVPEDLIIELLRILEAKSLLRFRSVSKSWNSIISHPSFAASHLKRPSRLLLLEGQERQSFRTADYEALKTRSLIEEVSARRSFPSQLMEACDRSSYGPVWSWGSSWTNLTICGSCNGICFGVSGGDLHLWNPTTGEVCSLPKPPYRREWEQRYGFGWDESVDDYKVVRVLYRDDLSVTEVQVLALKKKTWATKFPSDDRLSTTFRRIENKIVYCNGAVHWLVGYCSSRGWSDHVASFDLAEEKLQKLLIPRSMSPAQGGFLGVLGDCLCFYSASTAFPDPFRCNVWVMKDRGLESPWTKLMTIEDGFIEINAIPYVPLMLAADGGMIGVANGSMLVKHNRANSGGTTELMYRDGDGILNHQWLEVALYEETLVSLAAFGDTERS